MREADEVGRKTRVADMKNFPVGRKITRVSGALDGLAPGTQDEIYAVVLEFDDGSIATLRPGSLQVVNERPETSEEVPLDELFRGAGPNGVSVDGAFVRVSSDSDLMGAGYERQVLLELDLEWLFGVFPRCGGGTNILVEHGADSVILRGKYRFESVSGEAIESPAGR